MANQGRRGGGRNERVLDVVVRLGGGKRTAAFVIDVCRSGGFVRGGHGG